MSPLRKLMVVAAALAAWASTVVPASADTVSFSGSHASGAQVNLTHTMLPAATLPNVATQTLPCVPRAGTTYDRVAEAVLGSSQPVSNPVLRSGTLVNSGVASFDLADPATSSAVVERSRTRALQILHNAPTDLDVIAADAVDVTAQVSRAPDGSIVTRGSTAFVGLRLQGTTPNPKPPRPNTEISLDPQGSSSVVFNEQQPITDSSGALIGIRVTGIHVKLVRFLGYTGDIRAGIAQVKVQPAVARLEASASPLKAQGGTFATAGGQSRLMLPCFGTGGTERSERGVGVSQPVIGDVALRQSSVNGKLVKNPFTTYAYAVARTAKVDLLGGRIHADAVTSVSGTARATSGDSAVVSGTSMVPSSPPTPSSGTGSSMVNLVIDGQSIGRRFPPMTALPNAVIDRQPIGGTLPPNTRIDLPGIGRVTLNRQRCSRNGSAFAETTRAVPTCSAGAATRFEVIAIVVEVTVPDNALGLDPGVTIEIAAAVSGVSDQTSRPGTERTTLSAGTRQAARR
ncbi:MAG: hypothetical protein JWO02_2708 [Solirubrobacterales bacterium]|nr:hypothetical protein [Solirubrobacterales bacterium]